MTTYPALAILLQGAPGGSFTPLLFQFGLIFLIFYFLIIRPQQKQRKKHEEAIKRLAKGDRIVTGGGIVGEVVHIKQTVTEGVPQPMMDDEITIRSGESRLIVERGRITKITTPGATVETK